MKTQIAADEQGYVTISYDSAYSDDRVARRFFCPADGGYVKEVDAMRHYPQVCEKLSGAGSTLMCGSREKLPELIRKEYRAMRRAEKREMARYA